MLQPPAKYVSVPEYSMGKNSTELLDDILYAIHALPNTVYKGTYSQTYASNFVSKDNILEFFVRDWDSEFKQAFSKKIYQLYY